MNQSSILDVVLLKQMRIFPGVILVGFGVYFFLQQSQIQVFPGFNTWPTLLMIVGLAFLLQGYMGKDYEAILPGVILTGFGFHFHVVDRLEIWPNSIGVFILIIALGFLLRYQKTGSGLFQGILFLLLSVLHLFYNKIIGWLGVLEGSFAQIWKFWPVVLIGFGLYLLFVKRK